MHKKIISKLTVLVLTKYGTYNPSSHIITSPKGIQKKCKKICKSIKINPILPNLVSEVAEKSGKLRKNIKLCEILFLAKLSPKSIFIFSHKF